MLYCIQFLLKGETQLRSLDRMSASDLSDASDGEDVTQTWLRNLENSNDETPASIN